MSVPRNKLQDYIITLSKLPDFSKLSVSEIFLLGYSVGRHEDKVPISDLATQLIRSHNLSDQGLLTSTQRNMVEYLIFEGTYEGIDNILEAFTRKKASEPKPPPEAPKHPPEPAHGENPAQKHPHDSLPSTQELAKELQQAAKRPKPDAVPDASTVEIPDKRPAAEEEKRKSQNVTDSQNEKLSMDLITQLMDEEKKVAEQERKKKEEDSIEKAQCMICMERIDPEFYNPIEPCGHLFHIQCFKKYVEVQVNSRSLPILCPIPECKADVDTTFIKQILENDTFEKLEQYAFKHFVEGNSEEYSCCPSPDCTYVFVWVADEDSNDFTCPKCKKRYCLNCRCPYHKGMTCKEYEITNKHTTDDDKFLKFVKGKKFKQCPKCKYWVEKTMGCDHMTCRCKYQFCYKCGGKYMECECVKAMRARAYSGRRGRRK